VTPAVSARDYLEKALQAFRIANELPTWREAQALSAVAEDYLRLAEKVAAAHSAGKPLKGSECRPRPHGAGSSSMLDERVPG
jgi:hypothetical protein